MAYPEIGEITEVLPEPNSNYEKVVNRQNVFDIVKHTLEMHKETASDYDRISPKFWKGNILDTCHCIFDFCKANIPYDMETKKVQTVKTPGQILNDAIEGDIKQDCKHYALFCCGIVDSLKRQGYPISCFFRFASDIEGEKYPKHVFCVVRDSEANIWLDPVLSSLNKWHKYYYFLDKKCPMALYKVSGLGDKGQSEMICGFGEGGEIGKHGKGWAKLKKGVQNLEKGVEKKIHQAGKDIKHFTKEAGDVAKKTGKAIKKIQPGKVLLKVSLSASRNAFLLLLKLNVMQLAVKLFEHAQTPNGLNKIKSLWDKVGGSWSALRNAINQGYHHYMFEHKTKMATNFHEISGLYDDVIRHPGHMYNRGFYHRDKPEMRHKITFGKPHHFRSFDRSRPSHMHSDIVQRMEHMPTTVTGVSGDYDNIIGFVPAIPAAIAAAIPILKVFKDLLTTLGIDLAKLKKHGDEGVNTLADNHNESGDGTHDDGTKTTVTTDENGNQVLNVTEHGGNVQEDDTPKNSFALPNDKPSPQDIPAPGQVVRTSNDLNEPSPGVQREVSDEIALKEAGQEIPDAKAPAEKAVNVVTDWGKGIKNFVVNNKGVVITLTSITALTILGRTFLPALKKHRR